MIHNDDIISNDSKQIGTLVGDDYCTIFNDSQRTPRIIENDKEIVPQPKDIDSQKSDTHVNTIEVSASPSSHIPGHKQRIEGRNPAFIHHEMSERFHVIIPNLRHLKSSRANA